VGVDFERLENLGSKERPCPRTRGSYYGRTALFRSDQVNRYAPLSEDYQMTISRPGWRAPIREGDRLRINGKYENRRYAWYDAMAHVGLFIDVEQKPRRGCAPYPVRRQKRKADLLTGTLNRPWDHVHGKNACGGRWKRSCDRKEPDRGEGMETDLVTITTCRWPCNGPYVTNHPLADGRWDSGTLGFDLVDGGSRCRRRRRRRTFRWAGTRTSAGSIRGCAGRSKS
jgi:hypothetical protein